MKRKTDNFNKFFNRKSTGAVKEENRQEKKLIKKERREAVDRHFEEKRNKRAAAASVKTGAAVIPAGADKAAQAHKAETPVPGTSIPLNKYVAHAGVSSRRAAATLVREGKVTVNGLVVTDPGTKVLYTDTVKVAGKKVTVSSHFVYILLNKPKDFLTTTTDPQGRKTVQQLISKATEERVYPIGRLDRNTSGVLLFTKDRKSTR